MGVGCSINTVWSAPSISNNMFTCIYCRRLLRIIWASRLIFNNFDFCHAFNNVDIFVDRNITRWFWVLNGRRYFCRRSIWRYKPRFVVCNWMSLFFCCKRRFHLSIISFCCKHLLLNRIATMAVRNTVTFLWNFWTFFIHPFTFTFNFIVTILFAPIHLRFCGHLGRVLSRRFWNSCLWWDVVDNVIFWITVQNGRISEVILSLRHSWICMRSHFKSFCTSDVAIIVTSVVVTCQECFQCLFGITMCHFSLSRSWPSILLKPCILIKVRDWHLFRAFATTRTSGCFWWCMICSLFPFLLLFRRFLWRSPLRINIWCIFVSCGHKMSSAASIHGFVLFSVTMAFLSDWCAWKFVTALYCARTAYLFNIFTCSRDLRFSFFC